MDRSRYTQKVDTAQIQQDLRAAVTDAEILLQSFEMEVLEKLRQKVQEVVSSETQQSEQRLNHTLVKNCAREYEQLYENLHRKNRAMLVEITERQQRLVAEITERQQRLVAEITERQQRLERMLWIVIIIFSVLLLAIIATLLWLILKH
jgi:hypothetical protein